MDLLLVKDSNHAMCQRIIRDLRYLEELVLVDGAGTVFVELHESFLQPEELGRGDCGR